jgi:hypothetical protein
MTARSGQGDLAQGLYVCLASVTRAEEPVIGRSHSVARSGQKSIAQGLPWVIPSPELALKGPPGTARIGSGHLTRPRTPSSPFGFEGKSHSIFQYSESPGARTSNFVRASLRALQARRNCR